MSAAGKIGAPARVRLPEIEAERCVLSAVVEASCRACVDVCPRHALVLGEEALGLDTGICDGCGICAGACPQDAIDIGGKEPAQPPDDASSALLACEVAVPDLGKGVLPCLHALDLDDLAGLYHRGVRRLIVARGDCSACPRGNSQAFQAALEGLRRLLADRGLAAMAKQEQPAGRWLERRDELLAPSRRGFLRLLRIDEQEPRGEETDVPAAARLPPGPTGQPALYPFLPRIEPEECTACDACARVCRHGAIQLATDGPEGAGYVVDPASCTGCGLCVDVCEAGAVAVARWQRGDAGRLRLDTQQCKACGNVYREAGAIPSAGGLCRVCRQARRSRDLFQVIE